MQNLLPLLERVWFCRSRVKFRKLPFLTQMILRLHFEKCHFKAMQMTCYPSRFRRRLVSFKELMSVTKEKRSVLGKVGEHGSIPLPPAFHKQLEVYDALRT